MTCPLAACDGSGRIPLDGLTGDTSREYAVCPCSHPRPSTPAARLPQQRDPAIQVSR